MFSRVQRTQNISSTTGAKYLCYQDTGSLVRMYHAVSLSSCRKGYKTRKHLLHLTLTEPLRVPTPGIESVILSLLEQLQTETQKRLVLEGSTRKKMILLVTYHRSDTASVERSTNSAQRSQRQTNTHPIRFCSLSFTRHIMLPACQQ